MVTGEMDPVDHLNGSLLLLSPQGRSNFTTDNETELKIPHCQVQMLAIFQLYLTKHPEFPLKALHSLAQERELSHLLITTNNARNFFKEGVV